MPDIRKLNWILGIVAVIILAVSSVAFAYTLIPKGDTSKVIANGVEYTWDDLYADFEIVTFEINDVSYSGIRASDIINDTGLVNPADHQYRITGSDGYQKDVSWTDMERGLLTKEKKMVIFLDLPKSFWVKGVVEIEVV